MKSVTLGQLWAMLSLGVFSFGFQVHAKEYYKWVDAKGVTTYSATPQPVQRHEPQLDPAKKTADSTTTNLSIPASSQNVAINSKTTASIQTKPIAATTEGNNTLKASSEMLFSIKSCNGALLGHERTVLSSSRRNNLSFCKGWEVSKDHQSDAL